MTKRRPHVGEVMVRRNNFYQVVGEIDSDSQPGVLHLIKRHTNTGSLSCDCTAYRFSRGEKTCKHVSAYRSVGLRSALQGVYAAATGGRPRRPVDISELGQPVITEHAMSRPGVRRLRLRD